MIFFYSSTGNSASVALRLGHRYHQKLVDIRASLSNGALRFDLSRERIVGFITPTYFLGLPKPVLDFFEKASFAKGENAYFYHVATYGNMSGGASEMLSRLLQEKGLTLSGRFGVKMVDSYTPVFDCSDKKKIEATLAQEIPQIQKIAEAISKRYVGDMDNARTPYALAKVYYAKNYKDGASTKKFGFTSNCVSCGKCAKVCPEKVIEIVDAEPTWAKERCSLCLACLHTCPKKAIYYTKKSLNHGQYHHP